MHRSQLKCLISIILIITLICINSVTATSKQKYQTPLENSRFTKLTSHTDMIQYLTEIDNASKKVSMQIIGKSVEGRDIPLILISNDKAFGSKRSEKPIVNIFTQQHGNEPSGTEGALILIRELAFGDLRDLLKSMDVLITPMVNPDGGAKGQRRNSRNMDLNRNHAILSEPEVLAIHDVFMKWMPEVTMDVHEYNAITRQWISQGFVKDADEMMDGGSNLNIAPEILELSNDIFVPEVGKLVRKDGFTYSRYIVGAPFENQRIRHSTTDITDGRQSLGIYNTLSFLFEGKRYADTTNRIKKRTLGQFSALKAFLMTVSKHRTEVLNIVHSARKRLIEETESKPIPVQMEYFPDSANNMLKFPVFNMYSWRHEERELDRYEPIVRVKKSIDKPFAYIIPNGERKLIEILKRHQIKMVALKSDTELEVDVYTVCHVNTITEEDKNTQYVDVKTRRVHKTLKKSDLVVYLNQQAGNLIPLLLEPQSSYCLSNVRSGQENRLAEYLSEGIEYPVYRMVNENKLVVEK